MIIQHPLNLSSPIVQRVLRLRKQASQEHLVTSLEEQTSLSQSEQNYQWQTWQKSDLIAYGSSPSAHRCK